MISLAIFDFSGTLAYRPAGEYREIAAKLRDFNLPVNDGQVAKIEAKLPDYFSESSSWKELTDKVLQKLGMVMEADRREGLETFFEKCLAWKLFDDVESVLQLPQKKAILTLAGKFAVVGIPELRNFTIFTPEYTGAAKPDPKAFLAVLAKMKADPKETVMVGDTLENDILPAMVLGMKAILLDRHNSIETNDPSIIKINSLKELKKFL
jgi:HAD superfamily hydrolase (TIGR01509 family)